MNSENSVIARQPLRATIVTRIEIAKDTIELVLQPSSGFVFTAGQYVWIILPRLLFPDPKGRRRAFSIASPPQEEKLTFVYRTSPSGYKKTLAELPIGSDVEILGPFGFFTLQHAETPVVFLAGGTGVTPFLSIIGDLEHQKNPRDTYVLVSNIEDERMFYQEKLDSFLSKNPHIHASSKVGRLTWDDIKKCPTSESVFWYIAGPQTFVEGETKLLLDHGILPNQIHFDQFHGIVEKLPVIVKKPTELEKFKLAVENSTDHIIITDQNGIIEYANHAAELITGFNLSEMKGQTPRLWGGLMGRGFYEKLWKTIKYDRKPFISQIFNRKKTGELYIAEMHIAPIILGERSLAGFVASEKDITATRRAEEVLTKNEIRFRSLIEKSYEAIVLIDRTGKILYQSASAERILGYKIAERVGRSVFEFVLLEDLDKIKKIFTQLLQRPNESMEAQMRMQHKNGHTLWIQATGTNLLADPAVGAVVVNYRDITHEKEIDTAKTEFISLSSHQLRTPLSAIKWYIEMLRAGDAGPMNQTQAKYLEEVYEANQRMIDLVNLLLDVSRIEMGALTLTPEPINVTNLVSDIIRAHAEMITKKNLNVAFNVPPSLNSVLLDKKFSRIILENLISNAVKYTPEDGSVTITVEEKDSILSITVKDTGIGIPKDEQANMFTKAFRASNAKIMDSYGTGVGLYLVKSIVNQMKGTISFTTEEGKGSTFYVTFPFQKEVMHEQKDSGD